jgi:hypothetical protein
MRSHTPHELAKVELRWYHLAVLPRTPSPRAVLAAAAGMLNVRPTCIANAN